MYYQAFPDGRLDIHEVVGDGDLVVVRMTFHDTQTGNLMGMPATGKSMRLRMMTMYRFADGKVQEDWELSDRLGMLQKLGVIPQRGGG